MQLSGILPALTRDKALATFLQNFATRSAINIAPGARPGAAVLALKELRSAGKNCPLVVVTATGREAESFAQAVKCYAQTNISVELFPAWETLPHERLSPRQDTMARRIAVLRRLAHPIAGHPLGGPIDILIVPVRALLQPVVAGLGELVPVTVRRASIISLESCLEKLIKLGYKRTDLVEKHGDVAVRGGILDVFPPTSTYPIRVEFFGDEVEEVRYFSVTDQRTIAHAPNGLWAPSCRELLLTAKVQERARELARSLPGAASILEQISEGIVVEGMEALAPVLVPKMVPLPLLLPAGTPVIACDSTRLARRAQDLIATTEEFLAAAWSAAAAGGKVPIAASEASFISLERAVGLVREQGNAWSELNSFGVETENLGDGNVPDSAFDTSVNSSFVPSEKYRGDFVAVLGDLRKALKAGISVLVATDGAGPAKRIAQTLAESDTPARVLSQLNEELDPRVITVVPAAAGSGFTSKKLGLVVLTESDLSGRRGTSTREMRKMPARRRGGVDPLQLRAGDFIVHEAHGVGRFLELISRTTGTGKNAVTRDYLLIEYAPSRRGQPGDRLYIPTDSLDQITKYSGGESPALNKMGGSDWERTKKKARKAVKEIAAELIRLYAARTATKGHAFGPDTPWQRELEDAFAYVETPDQLVTIDEVKADMEKPYPMDRLLCGDVGYGKTEIAVRAAFKAVQDGKQVAVLVPTTLLAQQHYDTFAERYAGFPVKVAQLSRFTAKKDAETIKEDLLSGKVDVVIGTHTLLTGTVRFKDLGLVIVDEEQRFGVEHKETLKQLRTNVDVLSMSATPIPRTLEMAVTGIREMSTLATPPEERHPVLTYVGAASDKQMIAAIRRELLRDGQVFYVHNRVESISKTAAHIAQLVPEARVAYAHGKMSETQLERVILDFWNHEFDVLVCTTIVETGLDISNANTLIVDRADRMGLSQLHQLRGRVGRGRERAYAYFFHPVDTPLTETAHERLTTIATHTDLGAGMAVALKDLEIRGAGNLLGGEQSGHIAGVGFDLYVRMVSEAVAEHKGENKVQRTEVKMEIPVDAHLPEDYVVGERLRLEVYAKIAATTCARERDEVRGELIDRYGPIPLGVERLFQVAALREKVRGGGITEIIAQGNYIRFGPIELGDAGAMRLRRLHPGSIIKTAVRQLLVPSPVEKRLGGGAVIDEAFLVWLEGLLDNVLLWRGPGGGS